MEGSGTKDTKVNLDEKNKWYIFVKRGHVMCLDSITPYYILVA